MADTYQNQDPTALAGVSDNIFAQIRKEQWDFMFNWISIVPGYVFNQYYTIKRAHLYLNSRYLSSAGETTPTTVSMGDLNNTTEQNNNLFFNIVLSPCEVAMRMLNIDTKNIRLWPMNPKSQFSTYLLEKELKQWLKGHKFGLALNKLAEEAPRYGSVVLEKTSEGAEVVDLRRLILDPTVERIQQSRFVTTVTYMTPSQLKKATAWDQEMVDIAIERYQNFNTQEPYEDQFVNINLMRSTPYIKVFKRYGEVPAKWLDPKLKGKKGEEMVRALFIVAGADWLMKNNDGKPVSDLGVVLFKSKWLKDWPFKDFHYMKTRGRWLGIGIVEMLFDVQERVNEMKNQKRESMKISAIHLFQTDDKSIVRNVTTDLLNGDILLRGNNKDGLAPIANEERNFAAFRDEEESYSAQVDKLSFAYEALRGDTSDAGQATLGQTQIAVAQGTSVFAFKKENLSLFIQEFFNDLVLPQLLKDLTPEHIMRFAGTAQEIQQLDQAAAEIYANDHIMSRMLNYSPGDEPPIQDEHEAAKQKAVSAYQKLGTNRFLKIKEAFYSDAEFEFDFLVTDEQADPAKMAQNIQAVIAEVGNNPNILADPRLKLLFYKLCEQLGISPAELELADQQAQQIQQQSGMGQQGLGNQQQTLGGRTSAPVA